MSAVAGKAPLARITGSQATQMALEEAMALDDRVILLGEDVADREGGGIVRASAGLSTRFGDRVRSTPISVSEFRTTVAVAASASSTRALSESSPRNRIS